MPTHAPWQEHMINPQPPPLKIEAYNSPTNAATPDPEKIVWKPSKISGPVTVKDACRLYSITPHDIQDLLAHSKWIDLSTVAKRAVALHGGFSAHEELLHQRRDAEEKALYAQIRASNHIVTDLNSKSHFRFSPFIHKQWTAPNDSYLYEPMHPGLGGSAPPKQHRVAVLYPIKYVDQGDYGCEWQWMPDWGSF
ncbi:hypothetical protein B0H15DRAFT_953618 [Mycena belliarum]|uniref:Uncharacterized protein n=1 Tax=Mycena belliarum TaxID=1033014 RepID=A0AAD6TX22_9AGAR|nr:hypothetical protein B0H15DRAFT_953618 [Mycena belliae]